jgi:REP element-mobilizing transposase RayT
MVYSWFQILKKGYNAAVIAYVIMPNHLHVIIHFHNEHLNLNLIMANGKRFMPAGSRAYEIINRLEKPAPAICFFICKV